MSADQVIARLRGKLAHVPGATLYLQAVQDVRVGGRVGAAQYQYTLQGDDPEELFEWAPRVLPEAAPAPGAGRRQQRPAEQGAARPRS